MEENKRYIRLGLFVVVSLSVLVVVLFLLGGRKLFQPTFAFETYFNESVAGLEIGAPVRFRGVPLGQVSEIVTSSATYEKNLPLEQRRSYIVVRAKINVSAEEADEMHRDVAEMVQRGLRASTQLAGITGQQFIAIDYFDPEKYPPLEFQWEPKYTYVPSAPSFTEQIVAHAQEFLASLNGADIKDLGQNLNKLVLSLDKKVNDAPVAELIKNANATVERVNRIIAAAPIDHAIQKIDSAATHLEGLLAEPGLKGSVENVAAITARVRQLAEQGDLDRMIKRIDDAAERIDGLIGDNEYDIRVLVQDLRATAGNLRSVSETIKRYPAGALIAGPPEKIQLLNGASQ